MKIKLQTVNCSDEVRPEDYANMSKLRWFAGGITVGMVLAIIMFLILSYIP